MRVQVRQDNMTLELVVWRAFGRQDAGVVEEALALNPGIANAGAILTVGSYVDLPEQQAEKPALRETVTLWS